jgi:prepilin peptidase CpaA
MDQSIFAYALLGGLAIGLLYCVYSDIRYRLIYNKVCASIALAAPLYWLAIGNFSWPAIGIYLATGAITFLFFAIFFRFGMMGGGDVKLFAAVALWLEPSAAFRFIFNATLFGAAITIVFFTVHKLRRNDGKLRVPYGVAIAVIGLLSVGEEFFNQFG